MAFDDELAGRVREARAGQSGVTEQSMFGGLAWLVHRHLAVVALNGGGPMALSCPSYPWSRWESP